MQHDFVYGTVFIIPCVLRDWVRRMPPKACVCVVCATHRVCVCVMSISVCVTHCVHV